MNVKEADIQYKQGYAVKTIKVSQNGEIQTQISISADNIKRMKSKEYKDMITSMEVDEEDWD